MSHARGVREPERQTRVNSLRRAEREGRVSGATGRAPGGLGREQADPRRALSLLGGGEPLTPALRTALESRFAQIGQGFDFGAVRIHLDRVADELCEAHGAQALTIGTHIAFRAGRFRPASREGLELIAHELTHVLQASQGAAPASGPVSERADPSEVEARSVAGQVASQPADGEAEPNRRPLAVAAPTVINPYRVDEEGQPLDPARNPRLADEIARQQYQDATLEYVRRIREAVNAAAARRGVPPAAVAGAIADELDTRGPVDVAQDAIVESQAGEDDLVRDRRDNGLTGGNRATNYFRHDLGPGNVNLGTASRLVEEGNLTVAGSPRGAPRYRAILESLQTDTGTVEAAAAVLDEGRRRFEAEAPGLGARMPPAVWEAVLVEYYKQGPTFFERFQTEHRAHPTHTPSPGTDGLQFMANRDRILEALRAPAAQGSQPSTPGAQPPAAGEVRRSAVGAAPTADPGAAFAAATAGSRATLPYRRDMEHAFGQSFASVVAHTGRSGPLASIGARAAARGEHIAFAEAAPSRQVVAHELAHVLQSRRGDAGSRAMSEPGDAAEREADAAADRAASGQRSQVLGRATAAIHRTPGQTAPTATGTSASDPVAEAVRANGLRVTIALQTTEEDVATWTEQANRMDITAFIAYVRSLRGQVGWIDTGPHTFAPLAPYLSDAAPTTVGAGHAELTARLRQINDRGFVNWGTAHAHRRHAIGLSGERLVVGEVVPFTRAERPFTKVRRISELVAALNATATPPASEGPAPETPAQAPAVEGQGATNQAAPQAGPARPTATPAAPPTPRNIAELAIYTHGMPQSMDFGRTGGDAPTVARELGPLLAPAASVQLYGCSAARGDSSFAEQLGTELASEANGSHTTRVYGHLQAGRANDLAQGRAFEAAPGQATRTVENVDSIFPTHTADADAIAAEVNTGVTTAFTAEQVRAAHRDLLRQWVESRLARVRLPDRANSAEGIGYDPDAVRTAMQADLQTSPYAQPAGRVTRVREIATRLRRDEERRARTAPARRS